MSIPKPIQKAMEDWSKSYAVYIEYLGEYQGKGTYCYQFEEDVGLGFPFVYLLKSDNTVDKVEAPKSFEIIDSLVEKINVE